MRALATSSFVVAVLLLLATPAFSQGVAGVVRDTSGAILPGVTVEAASPALIEKSRTVVTDGSGQYRIVDLETRHLHRDVHAAWLHHGQARGHRADAAPA